VETERRGWTRAPMTRTGARPTVSRMKLPFTREPREPLRVFGMLAMTAIFVVSLATEPRPGLEGDGPSVALALAVFAAGVFLSVPHRKVSDVRRVAGLVALGAATCALIALQPNSVVYGAAYYVVIAAALRLNLVPALIIAGLMVAGASVAIGLTVEDPYATIASLYVSVVPWFLVMRLIGGLHKGREKAEDLVEELRESRAAHVESAALAERGRVARDMHDVLAHSLSALALQLEGARLLAQDRGSDPEVVAAVERAHHLAAEGLARRATRSARFAATSCPDPSASSTSRTPTSATAA
jgi:signal transduction histidine kinase